MDFEFEYNKVGHVHSVVAANDAEFKAIVADHADMDVEDLYPTKTTPFSELPYTVQESIRTVICMNPDLERRLVKGHTVVNHYGEHHLYVWFSN